MPDGDPILRMGADKSTPFPTMIHYLISGRGEPKKDTPKPDQVHKKGELR